MPQSSIFSTLREAILELTGQSGGAGQLYRALFDKSRSIMLLIHPESGRIIDANRAACSFYQHDKDELLQKNIKEINTLTAREVEDEMTRAKASQKNHFHFRHKLANGDIREVEVFSSPIVLGEENLLYSIIHDITARRKAEQEREDLLARLEKTMAELKRLKGILPLCSFCKKIRDEQGHWQQVDSYIHQHSSADISHTICPDCMKQHYPDYSRDNDT